MPRHEFKGQEIGGDICNRCQKEVTWRPIPDSLAQYCAECGFVRVLVSFSKPYRYEAGATLQEWLRDTYGAK